MTKGFIFSLSGDDYTIIRKASKRTQLRFLFIGILVGIITLASVFSWFMMLANLIEVAFYVFLLAVFISWMVANIYLLTLYTLSKRVLPCASDNGRPTATVTGKYLFLIALGLIVSTPYSVMIFQKGINAHIASYRNQQIKQYQQLSNQYMQSDSVLIAQIIRNSNDSNANIFFQSYLNTLRKEKNASDTQMRILVRRSSFYVRSVIILYERYPEHWLFTIPFIFIFIAPALMKHYLAESNEYYNIRRHVEMQLVEDEYKYFKTTYSSLISRFTDKPIEWREIHEDPPYNTKRKPETKPDLLSQDILQKELYHG